MISTMRIHSTIMEIMVLLLKGVSVLSLMVNRVVTCDASYPCEGLTIPDNWQGRGSESRLCLCVCVEFACSPSASWDFTECVQDLLTQIENMASQELLQETVENCLNFMMNITSLVSDNDTDQELILCGNHVLDFTEKLVFTLVRKTDNIQSINISLQSLEIQVIKFDLNTSVMKIPALTTTAASVDLNFTGILNDRSVSVALMSFTKMASILNARFASMRKTLISPVVSVTLPQVSGLTTNFIKVTFSLNHNLDPDEVFSCVYWCENEWVEGDCHITDFNTTHTVCSCNRPGTFAIIWNPYTTTDIVWKIIKIAFVAVGMSFLFLSTLTLAIYRPHKKVTNVTLINLCMSLLLALLLDQLGKPLRPYICPVKHLFEVLVGVVMFLYFSASMWMFNKAVLFFIFVKNLSKVRSSQGEEFSCKWLIVLGYVIPLVVEVVHGTVYHRIYWDCICNTNMTCTVTHIYFLPFYIIFGSNLILYIITIIIVIVNLVRLNNRNVLRSNCNDTKLIMSVMFKCLAQFFINGCLWLVYYLPINKLGFNVLNLICLQQGAFIFLFHCLLNSEVRQQYRKLLCSSCCLNSRRPAAEDGQEPQT